MKTKILIILIVLIGLGIGGFFAYRTVIRPEIKVEVPEVEAPEVEKVIEEEAPPEEEVPPEKEPAEGEEVKLPVQEGVQPTDQPFEWISDIMPGSGKGTMPPGIPPHDGPWNHRIMSATSRDGLTWTKDNKIIADQSSVPDAIFDKEGNIRIYYVDWYNGHVISVALSRDGINWIYKKVTIEGEAPGRQQPPSGPVDPDIVLLPDGRYRLYYMYEGSIYSAISNYGINFVKEPGVRFQGKPGEIWMDPDVVKMGDIWRMFTSQRVSAISRDGLTFTRERELTVGDSSCTIPVEGGYRMYYFGIHSAFSRDGVNWVEEGLRLDGRLADPAVIRLPDGIWKMFYKTWIEGFLF